jgi:hypothetical protein
VADIDVIKLGRIKVEMVLVFGVHAMFHECLLGGSRVISEGAGS